MIRVLAICKRSNFILRIQSYLLLNGIDIVFICNNSSNGIEDYKRVNPDIIIMDANWSNFSYAVSGSQLIQQLRTVNPACKIIISTNTEEPDTVGKLREYNISGYFYRNMNDVLSAIVNCVKNVYEGKEYFAD